jgi:hypothetical protein
MKKTLAIILFVIGLILLCVTSEMTFVVLINLAGIVMLALASYLFSKSDKPSIN